MEYRFKDGVRVYNDGISKEGYIVDCTVPRDEEYIKRLLAKAKHAKEYKNRILELFEEPQLANN